MYSKKISETLIRRLALPEVVVGCIEMELVSEHVVSICIQKKSNKLFFKTREGETGWFRLTPLVNRFAYACENCEKWFAYSPDDYKVVVYSMRLGCDKEFDLCPTCTSERVVNKMDSFDAYEVEFSEVFRNVSYFNRRGSVGKASSKTAKTVV